MKAILGILVITGLSQIATAQENLKMTKPSVDRTVIECAISSTDHAGGMLMELTKKGDCLVGNKTELIYMYDRVESHVSTKGAQKARFQFKKCGDNLSLAMNYRGTKGIEKKIGSGSIEIEYEVVNTRWTDRGSFACDSNTIKVVNWK